MQVIRRLYFYAISLVSAEVIIWGVIGLLRSIFAVQEIGSGITRLAGALALLLVGIPVFIIHWYVVQRSAQRDIEERSSHTRAIFVYLALLITLIPIVQNALALLNRAFLGALGGAASLAFFGPDQSWIDNLIAMLVNALAATYFLYVMRGDWRAGPQGDAYPEARRLYRYIWLVYSLVLLAFGLQQTIQFTLSVWTTVGKDAQVQLANGLALLILGAPIWFFIDRLIRQSLSDPVERNSVLRLVILYLLVFTSGITLLGATGIVIHQILRLLLGAGYPLANFLNQIAAPFSVALSFGLAWVYYNRSLSAELKEAPAPVDETGKGGATAQPEELQRRCVLRRLYFYGLALPGLAATFTGLLLLLQVMLELAFGKETLGAPVLRDLFAGALATLLVGLPVWLIAWRQIAIEAARENETGDHARRSLIRKSYLYLVLFTGMIGVMISAGWLFYQLFRALLGAPPPDLGLLAAQQVKNLLLFTGLLVFHWLALRADNLLSERFLNRLHAQYPVLVLDPEQDDFCLELAESLQRQVPDLPVAIHVVSQGVPDATLSAACSAIIPAELAIRPGEALRLWLQSYPGQLVILAIPSKGWHWIPGEDQSRANLIRQTEQIIRRLAEGRELPETRNSPAWNIARDVLAGLFILEMTLLLVILIASTFFEGF